MSHKRTLLQLARRLPVHRGRQLVALVCAMALGDFAQRAAAAWERDMEPARDAMVAALKVGDRTALERLRADLPALLGKVNGRGALPDLLGQTLLKEFIRTFRAQRQHGPLQSSASVEQWRGRQIFPTDFGSADLRGLSSELHLRSIFSARTTNADYLQEVGNVVDDMLSGKIDMATGRWRLMKKLKQLGYDPETGFPQDMADVPPAERGSLQDLSSEERINLMLKTNVALTRNYARVVEGNDDFARYAFPAWELIRLEWREVPRGEKRNREGERVADPRNAWTTRWEAAGESVGWEGAVKSPMMAQKDSPIWAALADGAGGYSDTLGHPFPPFAFNSGMDWRAVPQEDWQAANGAQDGRHTTETGPMEASIAPQKNEVQEALERLGPEFHAELLKELEDLAA